LLKIFFIGFSQGGGSGAAERTDDYDFSIFNILKQLVAFFSSRGPKRDHEN